MRDRKTLESVTRLAADPRFALLKEEAYKKIDRVQDSFTRLVFRTTQPVDPLKVEYDRGFQQGIVYALEALPNEIAAEWKRYLKEGDSE